MLAWVTPQGICARQRSSSWSTAFASRTLIVESHFWYEGLQLEAFREKVQALVLPGGGANPDAPGGVAGAALTGWMETLRVAGGHLDAPAFRGMLLRLAAGGPGEEGGRGAVDPRVLALLREKYLTRFADVRYAAWKAVRSLAREGDARPGLEESLSHGLYRLLLALGPPGDSGGGSPGSPGAAHAAAARVVGPVLLRASCSPPCPSLQFAKKESGKSAPQFWD